jgi:hypothetical protein
VKYPATASPKKMLEVPTIVLSYLPPEEGFSQEVMVQRDPRPSPPLPPPVVASKPEVIGPSRDDLGRLVSASRPASPFPDLLPATSTDAPAISNPAPSPPQEPPALPTPEDKPSRPQVVDEGAPRLELTSTPFVDSVDGRGLLVTLRVTNAGHRGTLVALRQDMVGFDIEGPDGLLHCPGTPPSAPLSRESFQPLKPDHGIDLPVVVAEVCGRQLFRRPGLYRVTARVQLTESGASFGLAAYTGTVATSEPTLVRLQTGVDPFYRSAPGAVRTRVDDDPHGSQISL